MPVTSRLPLEGVKKGRLCAAREKKKINLNDKCAKFRGKHVATWNGFEGYKGILLTIEEGAA